MSVMICLQPFGHFPVDVTFVALVYDWPTFSA
jgi:hypothetical protein